MELKHSWNDLHSKIILAAKTQLRRKSFKTGFTMVSAVQRVQERKNIPFYESWRDISEDLEKGRYNFWYIVFLQCCAAVLTDKKGMNRVRMVPWSVHCFLENLRDISVPRPLPVRLPDKQLQKAAENGDLPQIIMLYDMAANPGQKLKNTYHALLNRKLYRHAIVLHERYGGLDQISNEILAAHFLYCENESDEKDAFNKFFCLNFMQKFSTLWSAASHGFVLDKILKTVLECGIVPEGSVVETGTANFSLTEFLLLVDELSEELQSCYPWDSAIFIDMNMKKYMRMILRAAEMYSAWKKNQEENHA